MSLRLPYVLVAIFIAFLAGWLLHKCPNEAKTTPEMACSVISSNHDSSTTIRDRLEAVVPPPTQAAILTGRPLTSRENVSLSQLSPSVLDSNNRFLDAPFAIDTTICRPDNSGCDTVRGYIIPRAKTILAFEVRHAPIYVEVHDTITTVHTDIIRQVSPLLDFNATVCYEALGSARDATVGVYSSVRLGNLQVIAGPQLSLLNGLSGWVGLGFHIY